MGVPFRLRHWAGMSGQIAGERVPARLLALRDRAQAVIFAYESGLVTPGE